MYLINGTTLQNGKYRIVRFIASGGFGCTYQAEHMGFNRHVAIKEFYVSDFCNRDNDEMTVVTAVNSKRPLYYGLKKKFIEEANALFAMHHENIVRVIDVFEENNTAYYVMEYIDGHSLREIVNSRGALPESEALNYVMQVANALSYVHSCGRLHLDVKPGNIMVANDGRAVLIDFGSSKYCSDENGENTVTLLNTVTTGYAAPEQSTGDISQFRPATDVYALGATMYKLLTGVTPPSSVSLMSGSCHLQPMSADINMQLRCAVANAMNLNIGRRPASVADFERMLSAPQPAPNPKPKKWGLLLIISVLVVVVVACFAIFPPKPNPDIVDISSESETPNLVYIAPDYAMASSTLVSQVGNNYSASNMLDGDLSTCWSCPYNGRSEKLTFGLSGKMVHEIEIRNGYKKSSKSYYGNCRIREMSIYINDKFIRSVTLKDDYSHTSNVKINPAVRANKVDIVVTGVHHGNRWNDLCVSDILFGVEE